MEEVDLMQICRDVEGHLSIRAKEQQVKMTLREERAAGSKVHDRFSMR